MKTVKKFPDLFSANIAKTLLASGGIRADILNQNLGIIAGLTNSDLLSLELVVSDENYLEAVKILEASFKAE
ncbi:MAG: DUF2007 domain-containing protein [Bacteroidales bacterium]